MSFDFVEKDSEFGKRVILELLLFVCLFVFDPSVRFSIFRLFLAFLADETSNFPIFCDSATPSSVKESFCTRFPVVFVDKLVRVLA